MEEVKTPTIGNMVIYYNTNKGATTIHPAIVHWCHGLDCMLTVFTGVNEKPMLVCHEVPHRSKSDGRSYWDWPEIK